MCAGIARHEQGTQEPSRKRRRVSVDPEQADCRSYPFAHERSSLANFIAVKRPRLNHAALSKHCLPISRDKHYKKWLMNVGCSRRSNNNNNNMSLPTPDVTTRSFSRAPTAASSRKSTASVHDSDYREKLENYNTYVRRQRPPPGLWQEAEKMVFRRRDSPEMEGTAIDQLKDTIREIQTASEDEIRTRLGVHIIPGYSKPSDKRLHVIHGDLWCKTVPTPYSSTLVDPPLPLPKPKPDTTFAFSKTAFTESQLGIIKSLVQFPNGPSFASPHQDVRFPFAVVEYKSQARGGTIYIATNQAAGAGAVAMNGFLELMIRGPGLDAFDVNKPLFFSVTMDLEMPTSMCIG